MSSLDSAMSKSPESTRDISARQTELSSLSNKDLKKLHFKLTKRSSLLLTSNKDLINGILEHEYPTKIKTQRKGSLKRRGSSKRRTSTKGRSNNNNEHKKNKKSETPSIKTNPQDREKELISLTVSDLRKIHFRLTKTSSLTLLTKNPLIDAIMNHEYPEYVAQKKTESQLKSNSSKEVPEEKINGTPKISQECREAELNNLNVNMLKKLHFRLTKASSLMLVSKNDLIQAILQQEYPDYKPPVQTEKKSEQNSLQDEKSDSKEVSLPTTPEERKEQLNEVSLQQLRKLYFKLTKTSSLFYVSKSSLIDAIVRHEYKAYFDSKPKKKAKKEKW